MTLNSPYLWKPGETYKPLVEEMRITHDGRSEAVTRALSDFGIEESFERGANRFGEHYKYDIGSSAVSRVTKNIACEAQKHVENKLREAGSGYGGPSDELSDVDKMLVELDGCEIRTVQSETKENSTETSPVRDLPKKEKTVKWRDVRMGFARPLESVSKVYVGKMDSYPEVVGQLFNASVLAGLTPDTIVIGVADGGIGLMEELGSQFENMQFILDKQHLKDHFYETAEELGIGRKERTKWVKPRVDAIAAGELDDVTEELESLYGETGNPRVKRLIGYLNRFRDALSYDEYKEQGYPVGSGEVESAHKSVPQQRLKIPGASWHPTSIDPMLSLRILRANGWWEDFWSQRSDAILRAA